VPSIGRMKRCDALCVLPEKPETWKSLALLVSAARDYWSVTMWARDLHALFETKADLPEPFASLRRELAERLIERELLDFRRGLILAEHED
jgi:hypothetical protein